MKILVESEIRQAIRRCKPLKVAVAFDKIISEDPDLYQLTDEELSKFELVRKSKHEKDRK